MMEKLRMGRNVFFWVVLIVGSYCLNEAAQKLAEYNEGLNLNTPANGIAPCYETSVYHNNELATWFPTMLLLVGLVFVFVVTRLIEREGYLKQMIKAAGIAILLANILMSVAFIAGNECGPLPYNVSIYNDTSTPEFISTIVANQLTQTHIVFTKNAIENIQNNYDDIMIMANTGMGLIIVSLIVIMTTGVARITDSSKFTEPNDDSDDMTSGVSYKGGMFIHRITTTICSCNFLSMQVFIDVAKFCIIVSFFVLFGEYNGGMGNNKNSDVCQYQHTAGHTVPCIVIDTVQKCKFYASEHHGASMFSTSCTADTTCTCVKDGTSGLVSWRTNTTGYDVLCNEEIIGAGYTCDSWEYIYFHNIASQVSAAVHTIYHIPIYNPVIRTADQCDYSGFTEEDCSEMGRTITGNHVGVGFLTDETVSPLGTTQEGCFLLPLSTGDTVYWVQPSNDLTVFTGETVGLCKANGRSLNFFNVTTMAWQGYNSTTNIPNLQPDNVTFPEDYWNAVNLQSSLTTLLLPNGHSATQQQYVINDIGDFVPTNTGYRAGHSPESTHTAYNEACRETAYDNDDVLFKISDTAKICLAGLVLICVQIVVYITMLCIHLFTKDDPSNDGCGRLIYMMMFIAHKIIAMGVIICVGTALMYAMNANRYVDCPRYSSVDSVDLGNIMILGVVAVALTYISNGIREIPTDMDDSGFDKSLTDAFIP
jgi:hypothetical protein